MADVGLVGCPAEGLIELLIDRGTVDDLAEAHGIVDESLARRPNIPAFDLWWLKCRAMLAKADGDVASYTEAARRYLEMAERLDARGRLDVARRMVAEPI